MITILSLQKLNRLILYKYQVSNVSCNINTNIFIYPVPQLSIFKYKKTRALTHTTVDTGGIFFSLTLSPLRPMSPLNPGKPSSP